LLASHAARVEFLDAFLEVKAQLVVERSLDS
jgi:hypothetical protein